jgi:hypothetical protein
MTRTEKTMVGGLAFSIIGFIIMLNFTVSAIEKSGGIKAVIIDTGKEIKDIAEQIADDGATQ